MSSFVVTDETINAILTWANKEGIYDWYNPNNHMIYDFSDIGDLQLMATIVLNQNYASVNCRYNENNSHEIGFKFTKFYPIVQILKLIDCISYQSCDNEGWYKSDSFYLLAYLKDQIFEKTVRKTKEWDESKWGF